MAGMKLTIKNKPREERHKKYMILEKFSENSSNFKVFAIFNDSKTLNSCKKYPFLKSLFSNITIINDKIISRVGTSTCLLTCLQVELKKNRSKIM
jgi:hypothetical protein